MPDITVVLGTAMREVGRLRFESDGGRQYSQFEYADDWLSAADSFAIAPGLPLRTGGHFNSGRRDTRLALPGCFADAAPDSWGRSLMTRTFGGGLTEFDYLVLSDDHTRQGALRLLDENRRLLTERRPSIPRLASLNRIRSLAERFERNPADAEDALNDLIGAAGSLGGARPKANVEDNGHLWIAKFTSVRDSRPVERVEVATLKLATRCGLRAANAQLELPDSSRPVALIQRFDRRGDRRIPYISAWTALDWQTARPGSYTEIADAIRQISSNPREDLVELWQRIVFTILVSNTDDHLKNHGFLYAGDNGWRLSPAFDINPSPSRHRHLETAIVQDGPFDASFDLALESCTLFDVEPHQARQRARKMATTLASFWKSEFRNARLTSSEIRAYANAFEHADAEKALRVVA